ncbi:Hsp70 family protein [Kitasatospora kifunensis]|uniref:Hsp70 protein n=1 Tax=Kitasatospora kifunensis TaxID=58351 RepID=A0A7W7R8T0_KITKI|nr:Hsp70 family protein [Kitasatospora kifunensis]MBB4927557.1 hypothetical protein [Kitasatospora kifunensis]
MYGLDIGDSYARIAWLDADGRPVAADPPPDLPAVPATVLGTPGTELRVGRAPGAVSARSRLLARSAGSMATAEALVGCVLAELTRRSLAAGRPAPHEVVLGRPAAGDGEPELRRAAQAAGLRVEKVLPEPVAAALHYEAIRDGVRNSVLVYDQGATGLQLSLLAVDGHERTVSVLETVRHPLGGDHWDQALATELRRRLGASDTDTDPDGSLRHTAERLRLGLDTADSAQHQVRWAGAERTVVLDRETFESLVRPLREQSVAAVGALLRRARERGWEVPESLLLAGGLSATPGTAELFEPLGLYVRSRAPQAAVASGLALASTFGMLWVESVPRASTPGTPLPVAAGPLPKPLPDPDPLPTEPLSAGPLPTVSDPDPLSAPAGPVAPGTPGPEPEPVPVPGPVLEKVPTVSTQGTQPLAHPATAPDTDLLSPPPVEEQPTEEQPTERQPTVEYPTPQPHAPEHAPESTPEHAPEHAVPVEQLDVLRRDDHLLVRWAWPEGSREAQVSWRLEDPAPAGVARSGELRCSRRSYQHDGGLTLPVGRGAITLTVWALAPDPADPLAPPAVLQLPAQLPLVHYDVLVRRGLRGWAIRPGRRTWSARLVFTAEAGCLLPPLQVVHGLGRTRPTRAGEGTVLRELPEQRLEARVPLTLKLPVPATRGTSWLVCLSATPEDPSVDLRPIALHRLKLTSSPP